MRRSSRPPAMYSYREKFPESLVYHSTGRLPCLPWFRRAALIFLGKSANPPPCYRSHLALSAQATRSSIAHVGYFSSSDDRARKGGYVETVGYGCPSSTDGGIVHKHDSVQPEAGKIAEDIDFDLSTVHKRVSERHSYLLNWRDRRSSGCQQCAVAYLPIILLGHQRGFSVRVLSGRLVDYCCAAPTKGPTWLVEKTQRRGGGSAGFFKTTTRT